VAATVDGGSEKTHGTIVAGVSELPMLPGFAGEVAVSNKTDLCRVKTQYRHKYFSLLSNNAFKDNHAFALALNGVACSCVGLAAGVAGEVNLKKSQTKKFCDCSFESLNGRVSFISGPWTLFLQATDFGKEYSFSVMRKMLVPRFTNEMVIAARLTARAARPDFTTAKTLKEKAAAVNTALTPKATVAVRTKLTDFSSAKIKVDSKGMVGFSFSEQLSQYARAVFAISVDATKMSVPNNHKFAFTLTLMH